MPKQKEDVCKDGACGPIADGCGGLIDCGMACAAGQTCGGGGVPSKCGGNSACRPKSCQDQGITCGQAGDGCGGVIESCGTCGGGTACGGDPAKPGQCGGQIVDGGVSSCTPKTCTQLGATCGPQGDGCGNLINCGTCNAPQTCGGGGVPNACGGSSACVAKTCAQIGATCGLAGDGCGGTLNCGTCNAPQTCGGGGTPSVCGGNSTPCVKRTCAQSGANCGPVADGCGGTIQCGTCVEPAICGGSGVPSVCGGGEPPDAGQVNCPGTTQTTLRGVVYAPNGTLPLYNAIVYVPTAAVDPFPTNGVSCNQCSSEVSGKPLVRTTTGTDGSFTLTNVPVGNNIPVVIQLGRWRRQIKVSNVPACQVTNVSPTLTRLPKNKTEGDIPLTALSTGNVDALECLLRKMGIDDSEFSGPSGTGRIRMYQGDTGRDGHQPARPPSGNAVSEDQLVDSQATINKYDQVLFACEGFHNDETTARKQAVVNYANSGGRVFATHYNYAWLYNQQPFQSAAQWQVDSDGSDGMDSLTANVDTSFPKGAAFREWLANVDALSSNNPPQVTINEARWDLRGVNSPSQRWLYGEDDARKVEHFTFNMPWNKPADQQCGRVIFSDFHVTNSDTNGARFPNHCQSSNISAQEKILMFMLFDLASCIQPDIPPPPPTCRPRTCVQAGATCGPVGDGCGGIIQCGDCTPPQTCGGGGTPSQCGGSQCVKRTCAQAGATCGPVADGCGGILNCGECIPPQTCGGGGVPNQCGNPSCVPRTCQQAGATCGPIGDGCGGVLQCGPCTQPGETCGGGGSPNVCGNSTCVPKACPAGANCGPIADGCGGVVQCGTCSPGKVCGGGSPGTPNVCGQGSCTPRSCSQVGATCGPIGDGCGGQLDCGPCTKPGETCGGGGTPSVCGGCKPLTCAERGYECGPAGDGCGGLIECGECTVPGDTCGGGGVQFKCGHPVIN
ncbi:carboxypeptidase-like regulatory domain-containing protein [Pendulispora rubella]|uniref:Carboxypeptidase-like regulatory domain-containing protein n=1 Tax=Pendulispora rubella TaxID=2741070 RepID=A0ABZ2KW01_9BACT